MNSGYICANCLKFIDKDNNIYLMKDDKDAFVPLCSEKCVQEYKTNLITNLKDKIEKLETQNILVYSNLL